MQLVRLHLLRHLWMLPLNRSQAIPCFHLWLISMNWKIIETLIWLMDVGVEVRVLIGSLVVQERVLANYLGCKHWTRVKLTKFMSLSKFTGPCFSSSQDLGTHFHSIVEVIWFPLWKHSEIIFRWKISFRSTYLKLLCFNCGSLCDTWLVRKLKVK